MKKFLILLLFFSFAIIPVCTNAKIHLEEDFATKVVNKKTYHITAIDKDTKNKNGLVVYTSLYGDFTGTDIKGYEAVVIDNRVVKLNQYNSYIPKNGYVISGHGKAKKFITQNLFEGADLEVDLKKSKVKLSVRPENYLNEVYYRLANVEKKYESLDKDTINAENMEFYINRTKEVINTTKKQIQFSDIEIAPKASNDAIINTDMALYYSMPNNLKEFKGIWVFPYQKTREDIKIAFDTIVRTGAQNIFLEAFYNGMPIYKSNVAKEYGLLEQNPAFKDIDPLQEWIQLAKQNKMNIYVVFNTYNIENPPKSSFKQNVAKVHPDWKNLSKKGSYDKTNLYLDPANHDVQNFILDMVEEVAKNYEVAGIDLNGISYPKNYGYTKYARDEFKSLYGVDPVNLQKNDEKWINYKSDKIKELVNKIIGFQKINNKVKIAINVYPDTKNLLGWNINEDVILCPVMVSSDNNFAQNFLSEIKSNSKTNNIYPIYKEPYLEEKPRYLFDQIYTARSLDILGVILYDYENLNKQYYDALKLSIFKNPKKQKTNEPLLDLDINNRKKAK